LADGSYMTLRSNKVVARTLGTPGIGTYVALTHNKLTGCGKSIHRLKAVVFNIFYTASHYSNPL